jgi:hypothetical protein
MFVANAVTYHAPQNTSMPSLRKKIVLTAINAPTQRRIAGSPAIGNWEVAEHAVDGFLTHGVRLLIVTATFGTPVGRRPE